MDKERTTPLHLERKCFQETDVTAYLNVSVKSHSGQDMLTIRKVHTWEGGWFPHSPWTSGILNQVFLQQCLTYFST